MPEKASQVGINPADETISDGRLTVHFLITGQQSNGSLAAFELTVAGSQQLRAPAHSHDHYEETMYGIEGVLTLTVDGQRHNVGPGQALCIPRGAIHRFDNLTEETAKVLCVVTPAAIGPEYFREAFAILGAGGPPDRQRLMDLMRRFGLTPAPQAPTS
ncbi:MAG: cupin [Mesorhizobium sp. SCN 65-12]|nr:MAG: cupin [Mesorhizobium sp. SCN 65-12]